MRRKSALFGLHIIWWIVFVMACSVFAVSKWEGYELLQMTCGNVPHCDSPFGLTDAAAEDLRKDGLSLAAYGGLSVLFMSVANLSFLAVGALLYRYRGKDLFGLAASLLLITIGTIFSTDERALSEYALLEQWFHVLDSAGSFYLPFLFLFPNGRFVPRWSAIPAAVWVAAQTFRLLAPAEWERLNWDPVFMTSLLLATHGPLIYAMMYRYRRAESAATRRQLKWFLFSVLSYVAGGGLLAMQSVLQDGLLMLLFQASFFAGLLFWPFSIGIAILERNRDPGAAAVHKALLLSTLIFLSALLYALCVGGLSLLLREEEALASLLATGVIAALFHPLYVRLQRGINRLVYGDSMTPRQKISRLIDRMETARRQPRWEEAAEVFAKAIDAPYAAIELRDGSTLAEYGERPSHVTALDLQWDGEFLGVVRLGAEERRLAEMDGLLGPFVRQVSLAVYAAGLERDLKQSRERLVTAREEERRRLGRDLHDGLGASLAGLLLRLDAVLDQHAENTELLRQLQAVEEGIQESVADVRRMAYSLRPPVLDEFGLLFAVRELAIRYEGKGIRIEVEAPDRLPALSAAAEVAAYRIVQEAVANTVRHSGAGNCRIAFMAGPEDVEIAIEDDGFGIKLPYVPGIGIHSMRERAEEVGGRWEMRRSPAGGTEIRVRIPHGAEERGSGIA